MHFKRRNIGSAGIHLNHIYSLKTGKVLTNRILLILVLAVTGLFSAVQAQEPVGVVNRSTTIQRVDGKEYFFHAVLQGQTLFSIARAYNVTEEDIRRENPEIREHGLRYDQLIRIPVKQYQAERQVREQVQEETTFVSHQVRRRETLYGISRTYDVSMEEILEYNPDARQGLRPNMELRIPRKTESVVNYLEYAVPPGQTLFSISREFNVSIDELEKFNPELEDGLKAGQRLKIPLGGKAVQQPPFLQEKIEEESRPGVVYEALEVDPYCHEPSHKSHYNVALMIPLYLEQLTTNEQEEAGNPLSNPRHPAFTYMEYYQGLKLAVDSARAMGIDIRLSVYDVCNTPVKARTVLRRPEVQQMDLIIGPFHTNTFEIVAEFARSRKIPIISPLHWEDNNMVARFPNMFQATPSMQTQVNDMALYVAENHADDNIILVHNNQPGVIDLIRGYKNTLNTELNYQQYYRDSVNLARIDGYFFNGVYVGERLTNVYVLNDSLMQVRRHDTTTSQMQKYLQRDNITELVYSRNGMDSVKSRLDTNRRNVLVTLMGGEAIIPDYARQLNMIRDTFDLTVFGVPQWRGYRAMDYRYMQNIRVHLFNADFIDYDKKHNIDFVRQFRKQNHVEPGTLAFRAVNTGMFFFSALHQYGSEFWKCTNLINETHTADSPFWFQKSRGEQGGWENKYVYLIRYENFRMRNVKESKQQQAERLN